MVDVVALCNSHDIVLLQETWLLPQNLCTLHEIHDSFYGDGISAVKTDEGILVGRPHGGLAVLWRKSLNAQLQVVKYDDEDRLMGIVVKSQRKVYHFLNVYLPYECKENVHDFTNYLCKMHTIFMNNNTEYNLAVGDFNANITRDSLFGLQLLQFCEDNCYTLSDSVYMPDTSFTFHSDAHDTVSWLDHAVSSFFMHEIISEMDVLHNYLTSDHYPLSMCIQIGAKDECPTGLVDDEKLIKFHKIEWDQLKPDVLSTYRQTTDSLLGDIELPDDIVDCSGVNCDNHSHINSLSELYGCIMHCLSKADKACIPEQKKCHVSPVPGWNDYLAEPYKESREAYFLWCSYNKPRSGVVHELMKKSRARFKYAQNQVLKNEKTLRANALASKLANGDIKCFW